MIKGTPQFTICPDDSEAKNGCECCDYCYHANHDWKCMIFNVLGQKRLALKRNFCPLTGKLISDGIKDGFTIYAAFPSGRMLQITSINDIKQRGFYTFEALCIFEDKTSAWVSFDYIKNEEEI